MRGQPVTQGEQPAHRRGVLRDELLALAGLVRNAHTGRDLRLVNIQRRRTLDDRLHHAPFPSTTTHRRPGASRTNESDSRARSTVRSSGRPHTPNSKQTHRHQGKDAGVVGDLGIIAPMHARACRQSGQMNSKQRFGSHIGSRSRPRARSQSGGESCGCAHSASSGGSRCQPGMPPMRNAIRR